MSPEIDIHGSLHFFECNIEKRFADNRPGIVHQNVDGSKIPANPVGGLPPYLAVGD